jgi:hypothetical protein
MFFHKSKSKFDIDMEVWRAKIDRDVKEMKDNIEKVEIRALEAQKSYRAKLKRLVDGDKDTNIKDNVFLSPKGEPI